MSKLRAVHHDPATTSLASANEFAFLLDGSGPANRADDLRGRIIALDRHLVDEFACPVVELLRIQRCDREKLVSE
jgi:hypothetical protein